MAYMERLGLWGVGTAFDSFGAFEKAMGVGGVGAMGKLPPFDIPDLRSIAHSVAPYFSVSL